MHKILALTILVFTSACQFHAPFLYKQDIAQGNVFSAQDLQKITLGMDRRTVHHLLGTPQYIDEFRPQSDVYYYRYYSGNTNRSYQSFTEITYDQNNQVIDIKKQAPKVVEN